MLFVPSATHNFPQMTKNTLEVYTCIYVYTVQQTYINHIWWNHHIIDQYKKYIKNSSGQTKLFPWFTNQRGKHHRSATCFVKPSSRRSSQVRNHQQAFFGDHQQAIFPVGLFLTVFGLKKSSTGFGQRLVKKRGEHWKFGNDQMLWLLRKTRIKTSKSSESYVIWIW